MEDYGISWALLIAQLLNIMLLAAWITLAIVALMRLAGRELSERQRLGWIALILLVPVLGAIAFLVVRPGRERAA